MPAEPGLREARCPVGRCHPAEHRAKLAKASQSALRSRQVRPLPLEERQPASTCACARCLQTLAKLDDGSRSESVSWGFRTAKAREM